MAATAGRRARGPDDAAARTALTTAAPAPARPRASRRGRRPPASGRLSASRPHPRRAGHDPHLVGLPHGPRRLEAEAAGRLRLPRLHHAGAAPPRLRGGSPPERAARPRRLPRRGPRAPRARRPHAGGRRADRRLRGPHAPPRRTPPAPRPCSARERSAHDHLWLVAGVLARFFAAAAATPRYGSVAAIEANLAENFEQARAVRRTASSARPRSMPSARGSSGSSPATRTASRPASTRRRIREGHGDLRLEHVYFEHGRPADHRLHRVQRAVPHGGRRLRRRVPRDGARGARTPRPGRPASSGASPSSPTTTTSTTSSTSTSPTGPGSAARSPPSSPRIPRRRPTRRGGRRRRRRPSSPGRRATRARPRRRAPSWRSAASSGPARRVLAEALARALALPVVASDRTRKWLAGVGPTERAPAAAYEPVFSDRTFDEVFRRAAVVVGSGRGVVLDATFRGRDLRGPGPRAGRPPRPPLPLRRGHVRRRDAPRAAAAAGGRAVGLRCDGALLARVRAEFEAVTELAPAEHLVVRTTEPVPAMVETVQRALRR